MKFFLRLILCCGLAVGVLIACGSDDNGTADDDNGTAPTLSNVHWSPTSAPSFSGNVPIEITYDFTDPDGDLAFARLSFRPCGLGDPNHYDTDLPSASGIRSGYGEITGWVDTSCPPGTYQATFKLCDQRGNWSNPSTIVMTLTEEDDDSGSPPTLSNVHWSPTSAPSFSGNVTVTGTYDFTDPDGDLDFVRFSNKQCGLGDPVFFDLDAVGVSGVTSATMDFSIFGDTSCPPGTYPMTLQLCDERGNWSNKRTMVFTLTEVAQADPVLWETNGHYYEAIEVPSGITWDEAKIVAEGRTYLGMGGHLATVTSEEENSFIHTTFGSSNIVGFLLGGFQELGSSEPSGGWTWVTGEEWNAWDVSNWKAGEPNNTYSGGAIFYNGTSTSEEVLQYSNHGGSWASQFNDVPNMSGWGGYIVEYE